MEIRGIKVKKNTLNEMAIENQKVIETLTQEIYELAGQEFNINSPKQLGKLLFETLGLPVEMTKKNKNRLFNCSRCIRALSSDFSSCN